MVSVSRNSDIGYNLIGRLPGMHSSSIAVILCTLFIGSTGESPDAFENGAPGELFSLLAECETEKQPGRELLGRAKVLRWPLLAVVASCFADVTPLSCLTTWLELTAARYLLKCNLCLLLYSSLSSSGS